MNYQYLQDNNCILFETIVGSQAYGTNIKSSDEDRKFVFIPPLKDFLAASYIPQIEVNKDYFGYDILRFLELLSKSNPTLLEMLFSPEDCIKAKHPLFEIVLENRDQFITKRCKDAFGNYARQQIRKAQGLNKKQNWEEERITRKEPIDFCYIIDGYHSFPLKQFLNENKREHKFCGIAKIPHARDLYALFYDQHAHDCFSQNVSPKKQAQTKANATAHEQSFGFGYKGIQKSGQGKNKAESNSLRLSSIPKGQKPIAIFSYNQDSYTKHCDDFKEYQQWLKSRNTQRWVEVKGHGQKIDGKNLMHCIRLLQMAEEIASGKGIRVRRSNREELLAIRNGKVPLESLIEEANNKIITIQKLFDESNLPEEVAPTIVDNLLFTIRSKFYHIK